MSTSPSNAARPKRQPQMKRTSSSAVNSSNNSSNSNRHHGGSSGAGAEDSLLCEAEMIGKRGRCPTPTDHPDMPEIIMELDSLKSSPSPATSPSHSLISGPSSLPSSGSSAPVLLGDQKIRSSKLSASFRLARPRNAATEAESGGDSSSSSISSRFLELLKRPFAHRKKSQQQQQQLQQQPPQQQQQQQRQRTIQDQEQSPSSSLHQLKTITESPVDGNLAKSNAKKSKARRIRVQLASGMMEGDQSSSEDLEEPEVVQVDGQLLRSHSSPQLKSRQKAAPPSPVVAPASAASNGSQERSVRVNFIPADKGLHNSRYSGKTESPRRERLSASNDGKNPASGGRKSAATPITGSSPQSTTTTTASGSPSRRAAMRLPALTLDNIISSGLESSKGEAEETASAMQRARQQWILQHINTADEARSATHVPEAPRPEPQSHQRSSSSSTIQTLEPSAAPPDAQNSVHNGNKKIGSRGSFSSNADGTLTSSTAGSSKKRLSIERRKSIEKRMSLERKRQSLEFFLKDIGEDQLIEKAPIGNPESSMQSRKRHSCSAPHLKRHTSEPKLNSTSNIADTIGGRAIRNGRRTVSSRNLMRERLTAGKFKTNEFFGFKAEKQRTDNSQIVPEQIGALRDAIRTVDQQSFTATKAAEPDTPEAVTAPKLPIPQLRQHATSIGSPLTSPRSPQPPQTGVTDENRTASIGLNSHQQNMLTNSMQALSSILQHMHEGPTDRSAPRLNAPQLLGLQPQQSPTSSSGSDTQNMTRRRRQWNQQPGHFEATSPTAAEIVLSSPFGPSSPNPPSLLLPTSTTNFVLKPFQHLVVGSNTAPESGNESDTLCIIQTPPSYGLKPLHTAQPGALELQSPIVGEMSVE